MKQLAVVSLLFLSATRGLAAEAASGPMLQIAPKPVHFPRTTESHTSYASATVTNVGTADVTITKLTIDGESAFGISADGCTGFTAAPGESCDLELGFSPDHYGLWVAWLLVFDNQSASPQYVLLEGCGYSQGIGCQKQ